MANKVLVHAVITNVGSKAPYISTTLSAIGTGGSCFRKTTHTLRGRSLSASVNSRT